MNIPSSIKSVEDLRTYQDDELKYHHILNCNPYSDIVKIIEEGYQLLIGPSAPLSNVKKLNRFIL